MMWNLRVRSAAAGNRAVFGSCQMLPFGVVLAFVCSLLFVQQAVSQSQTITLRSGPGVNMYAPNPNCAQPLKPSPFTAADFAAANAGGAAPVIFSPIAVWLQQLPCDQLARWIGFTSTASPRSALFAQPFTVYMWPYVAASLTFCWAADDRLGDPTGGPNPAGVYINGYPFPALTGGNYAGQTQMTVTIPPGVLNLGTNWFYVYNRDMACAVSGAMYSATITVRGRPCPVSRSICQPWNDCLPAVVSRVEHCDVATILQPFPTLAMDDFTAKYTGPVRVVDWWGVLCDINQRNRPFSIAFYRSSQTGDCRPLLDPVYSECVKPISRYVGTDCNGQPVFHFRAVLPAPGFMQVAGQQYWLQIAEVDALSARVGQIDFLWSGHRSCNGVCGCPALFRTSEGMDMVMSNCDNQPMDLAWCLRRNVLNIRLGHDVGVIQGAQTYNVEFFSPGSQPFEGTIPWWTGSVMADDDPNGGKMLSVAPDIEEGNYQVMISGMGAKRRVLGVHYDQAVDSFFDIFVGDLDSNMEIDDADLTMLILNFGM